MRLCDLFGIDIDPLPKVGGVVIITSNVIPLTMLRGITLDVEIGSKGTIIGYEDGAYLIKFDSGVSKYFNRDMFKNI
jgi:hypothetical protein